MYKKSCDGRILSICVPKKLTVSQLASRKERRRKYKVKIKIGQTKREKRQAVSNFFVQRPPTAARVAGPVCLAPAEIITRKLNYIKLQLCMERGRVLKGRSDRAEILGTVGRRVLRLQYTLDANAQLTRSQNSTYLCQSQSVTSV